MPRQRTLKPELFRDKTMARLGPLNTLVYEALWCWADDGGVARIEVDLLKGEAFARWHDITPAVLMECLVSLHEARRIRPYIVGDEIYAEIRTLEKHSPVNHPSKFRHPRNGQEVMDLRAALTGQLSLSPPVALRESSYPSPSPLPFPFPVPSNGQALEVGSAMGPPSSEKPVAHATNNETPGSKRQRSAAQGNAHIAEILPAVLPR